MLHTIENNNIKATISSTGCELQSLILKKDHTEYLWQADPDIWGSHAPLLFPFIGRLKNGEYTFEGETYHAPTHGFARSSEFEVISKTADSITFLLKPNELSAAGYPFTFEFQVSFTLEGNTLKKVHTIKNCDTKALYYEVGGHDGYNLCLEEGETMEDYYLDFGNLTEIYPREVDEDIYILESSHTLPLKDGKLPLRMDLFVPDALILHDIRTKTVSIKSNKSDRQITFDFPDFKTLAIWTKYMPYNTNYICLEPWTALPECAYVGKDITQKVDIRRVEPGESETLCFMTTIQ